MRVLVVDDDTQILRALRTSLRSQDYDVRVAQDGTTALHIAASTDVDLILLDLGLPDIDGVDVIERLRTWTTVPIIVLSVRDRQEDRVKALDLGADDYLTKPFGIEELLARMRAVARRTKVDEERPVLSFLGKLEVDLRRDLVKLAGKSMHLTPIEYKLLREMATNPGKLLTHRWLLQRVWGPGYGNESHYLRVFVRQLRQKLGDDPTKPRFILTESGLGYRWIAEPDQTPNG